MPTANAAERPACVDRVRHGARAAITTQPEAVIQSELASLRLSGAAFEGLDAPHTIHALGVR